MVMLIRPNTKEFDKKKNESKIHEVQRILLDLPLCYLPSFIIHTSYFSTWDGIIFVLMAKYIFTPAMCNLLKVRIYVYY